nr:hypothetical protein BaRGS_024452 [Batillaria attramentaria]
MPVLAGAFLISWVPYAIVSFLETFTARHVVSDVVETFPAIIAKCSAIWNPIIYIATNIQFRRAFFAMCPCCEAFLGYCASDEDSVGSETQIGPESRAPVPDISSRVRQVGEVGGGGGGRGLSEKSAKVRAAGKDGNCNPGVCHETITLDTRVSISPENVKQKRGSARGNGGSVRSGGDGGGKGVKQAFDRMPDVETNCSSKRANVEV